MPLTPAEKQRRYRDKIKRENPVKYEQMKKKTAESSLNYYKKKVAKYSTEDKELQRRKWKEERERLKAIKNCPQPAQNAKASKCLNTIKACSAAKGDGLLNLLGGVKSIRIHAKCRKRYTRRIPISTTGEDDFFRQSTSSRESTPDTLAACPFLTENSCMPSTSHTTCFADACFLCCAPITDFFIRNESRKPSQKRNIVATVRNMSTKTTIMRAALKRNDQFGKDVLSRIENVDLVQEKARYHQNCYNAFYSKKKENNNRRGRPKSDEVVTAMATIFNHIKNQQGCRQFSITELKDILSDKYVPHDRTLKEELKKKYGKNIVISNIPGGTWTVTFKDDVDDNKIMDESWSDNEELMPTVNDENLSAVLRAANIVRDDIRSEPNETELYPLGNAKVAVPDSLLYFLETVMAKDKKENGCTQAKILEIAHAIVTASRPRPCLKRPASFDGDVGFSCVWVQKRN